MAKGSGKSSIKRSKGSSHVANSPLGAMPLAGMNAPQGMPSPGQAQGGPNAPLTAPQMPPAMGPGQPY